MDRQLERIESFEIAFPSLVKAEIYTIPAGVGVSTKVVPRKGRPNVSYQEVWSL